MRIRYIVAGLSLSAAGLLAIADFEGFRQEAYVPVAGDVPTIGFGHTEDVRLGQSVTVPEALSLLRDDVREAEKAVRDCIKVPLTQSEFDSFTSFAFNVGRKAFCESTLVRKANSGDFAGACAELKRWVYVGDTKLTGLVNRREAEWRRCMGELSDEDSR